jgi:hypothetical protein
MTSILTLPNELLQKVASHLPFSALLRLQYVNRRLHTVCDDRLVVQSVAQSCFSNTPGALESLFRTYSSSNRINFEPGQLEWEEGGLFVKEISSDEIRKLAHTVQRCTDAVIGPGSQDAWTLSKSPGKKTYDISEWLPQLLALHHPAALVMEPKTFLRVHGEIKNRCPGFEDESPTGPEALTDEYIDAYIEQAAEFVDITFVMCYMTLQHLSTNRDSKETIKQFEEFFLSAPSQEESPDSNNDLSETEHLDRIIKRLHKHLPRFNNTLPQVYAVLLPTILQLAVQHPAVAAFGSLPDPRKIPFIGFMDIRQVYDKFDQGFNTCHVRGMTSPQFLAGRWTGYYSDRRGWRSVSDLGLFDPRMRDINLVTRTPSEYDIKTRRLTTIIDGQSRGVDEHGEFTLQGYISGQGVVKLEKRYIAADWTWTWAARVTPFGIVGFWGGDAHFGGFLWIYKEEWC